MERNVPLETAIAPVEEVQQSPAPSVPTRGAHSSPAHNILSLTVLLPPNEGSSMNESGRNAPLYSTACSVGTSAGVSALFDHQINDLDELPPPKADLSAPPPYELATKLPTYEEVQREKTLHGEPTPGLAGASNSGPGRLPPPLAFLAIDAENPDVDAETGLLGTDFMFFTAFLVAFLFNWIGFLLLMCFCHTIAARYGALSGFGLSLAKWTLIVKHSTDLASRENSWLWWLIMAFGLLICVRAIIQYLNIKRGWRLLSGSAQERLLFFY